MSTTPSLIALSKAFDALHAEWMQIPQGVDRDDVVDWLNEYSEAIRLCPAATMDEVAVKARNLLWSFGPTYAGGPSIDSDPTRHELAVFAEQLEAFTRLRSWA